MTRIPIAAVMACALGACGSSHDRDADASADPGTADAGPRCTPVAPTDEVDLLFVLDNSNDMAEENQRLVEQIPRLFEALATAGLDVHAGVVTSDMGTGGFEVPSCDDPELGDDGILRSQTTDDPGCTGPHPRFISFGPADVEDTESIAREFSCVARVGTGGCGFEQPLEAMLKAVTPSSSPLSFQGGSVGHGDGPNAGFLREGSVLAVLLLTKETDCSVADPALFDPDSTTYAGNLSLRCLDYPEALQPIERFADGLLALRPAVGALVFAAVVGVPPDLVGADYDTMLADVRMRDRRREADDRPEPSCRIPGSGLAFPPRRVVGAARQLRAAGARTTVQSICEPEYGAATDALVAAIEREAAGRPCP